MSTPMRWILALLLILVGIGLAALAVLGGAFSTVACAKSPADSTYYVLMAAGVLTLATAAVPAIMLIRRSKAVHIVMALVVGTILSCGGYGAYLAVLSSSC
jgi:hypothetical protein